MPPFITVQKTRSVQRKKSWERSPTVGEASTIILSTTVCWPAAVPLQTTLSSVLYALHGLRTAFFCEYPSFKKTKRVPQSSLRGGIKTGLCVQSTPFSPSHDSVGATWLSPHAGVGRAGPKLWAAIGRKLGFFSLEVEDEETALAASGLREEASPPCDQPKVLSPEYVM